jgi:hypothetical protein
MGDDQSQREPAVIRALLPLAWEAPGTTPCPVLPLPALLRAWLRGPTHLRHVRVRRAWSGR